MFSIPSAPQKRFIAKGRSRLTVTALIESPMPSSSWLNFLVWIAHTPVSSDGTTLSRLGLPFRSASESDCMPSWKKWSVKSGASAPAAIASPARVIGLPLNVIAPERDIGGPRSL